MGSRGADSGRGWVDERGGSLPAAFGATPSHGGQSTSSRRSSPSVGAEEGLQLPSVSQRPDAEGEESSFTFSTREQERQKYLQQVRSAVQKDIQKVLLSNKAYVRHVAGPPVMSRETMSKLSAPHQSKMHPENRTGHVDPIEYAQWKAEQLGASRQRAEAQAGVLRSERDDRRQRLDSYLAWKQEQEQLKREKKAQEEEEAKRYGRALAGFVQERAREQLEGLKEKRAKELARGEALRTEALQKSFLVGRRGHQTEQHQAELVTAQRIH